MPSISLFIKQLLAEDKYSADFSERIDERIGTLNAAQLQGMYNHLIGTAKASKCDLWSGANHELIRRIEGTLKARTLEEATIQKALEEEDLRHAQKKRLEHEGKEEKRRVMLMIAQKARSTAEKEVRDEEQKRQGDEKMLIMQRVFNGEERRNRWWIRIAVSFVLSVVIFALAAEFSPFQSPLVIFAVIGAILLSGIICGVLAYYASTFTAILPLVVEENELERRINERVDFYKQKAVGELKEKERRFILQERQDEIDRRQRKKARKKQLKFEAKLMEARRLENIAMAKEVIARKKMEAEDESKQLEQQLVPQFSWDYQSQSERGFGSSSGSDRSDLSSPDGFRSSSLKLTSSKASLGILPIKEADREAIEDIDAAADDATGVGAVNSGSAWLAAAEKPQLHDILLNYSSGEETGPAVSRRTVSIRIKTAEATDIAANSEPQGNFDIEKGMKKMRREDESPQPTLIEDL